MTSNQDQGMWLWKFEPVSPKGTPQIDIDEDWLLFDDKSSKFSNHAVDPVMYDDQPTTRAQAATKLLEELDEWIKEEPFSDWLEEKIDLPIFEELPTPECGQNKAIVYSTAVNKVLPQQDNTQTLLQEFETVLGDVEACHQIIPPAVSTLTPPQSPPPNKQTNIGLDTQLLVTLQPVQTVTGLSQQQQQHQQQQQPLYNVVLSKEKVPVYTPEICIPEPWNTENISLDSLTTGDVATELAVVDEYVRSHTEDIPPPYSPCTSSGDSCVSEDSTDDPDWVLETANSSSSSCSSINGNNSSKKQSSHLNSNKNRYKPYSRPSLEDKKVRKKEQNKNAATRYRQKKKQEIKEILGEERELTDYNDKLKNQVKDLQREIGYLKGLMRDLFKAKGLIK